MRSIVLSVPHSGTRFVHEHMNTESYHHTWDKWECMVENCKTADHIYVAMRHPKDVRMSWIRRGVLHNKRSIYRWYMSWYQLQACDELFDLDVICVDKQEDPRIKNWEKIGMGKMM